MSNRTRSLLKVLAILLVALAILMEMSFIIIPVLTGYKFWMVVIGFAVLLITGR